MNSGHGRLGPTKIVLTGAGGQVGRQLVSHLQTQGLQLLLVGRRPEALARDFVGLRAIGYEELPEAAKDFDVLVHLAVLNNDVQGSFEEFRAVNVDLALLAYGLSRQAGVREFVYVSSLQALDPLKSTHYAVTKRDAAQQLLGASDGKVRILYLPAVMGESLSGRLRSLERLPPPLRSLALAAATSLKPTVNAEQVAASLLHLAEGKEPRVTPWIVTKGQADNLVFAAAKRGLDLVFAVSVVALLGWLLILLGVAIRMQSPGPALFRQARMGRNQCVFTCFKFRTMYSSTPNVGTHEVAASSVTRLGKFLRRTKLDELPQVLNILMNQMSLVGPRPSLPTQKEVIAARARHGVYSAKPGITGLSQVRGIDMSAPEELAASDANYLELQSIALECQIMVQTLRGKGGGDRVRVS
jgi:lipopolysaccharide/colanic/teichoic acid biosynthesis glycosyltransferase